MKGWLAKAAISALVLNEVRGFLVAAPVIYTLYRAGGTGMAVWLALCSLGGVALSVVVPVLIARKLSL